MNLLKFFTIPLGKWFGVPVYLHWSWSLLFLLFLFTSGPSMAVLYAGAFFLVLLHECGHCLAAQQYGIQPIDITLYPIGGAARMDIPIKPKEEFVVAIAGPAVNVFLIPLLYWLMRLSEQNQIFTSLFAINIMLILFNLVPAFPMDGGRVLRSLLSMMWGHEKATHVAGRTGQVFCVGFVILGIVVGNPFLAIIGVFIFFAAEQEMQAVRSYKKISSLYRLAFGREPDVVSPHDVEGSARMLAEIQQRVAELEVSDVQQLQEDRDSQE